MNLAATIIGLVILVTFIGSTVYLSHSLERKKKKFLSLITEIAKSQSCIISDYDQWKDSCIGVDKANHKIFYLSKKSGNLIKSEINLHDVAKCKLVGVNMSGNTISSSHNSIDEIELCFSFRDASKKDVSVEFFKISTDFTIVNEDLKLAEKWHKIVNEAISGLSKKN